MKATFLIKCEISTGDKIGNENKTFEIKEAFETFFQNNKVIKNPVILLTMDNE